MMRSLAAAATTMIIMKENLAAAAMTMIIMKENPAAADMTMIIMKENPAAVATTMIIMKENPVGAVTTMSTIMRIGKDKWHRRPLKRRKRFMRLRGWTVQTARRSWNVI